ncbi:hypothetical protein ASPZODRAFT_132383 [Penicilliopsis zonata CBS 506.65]|uniref:DUF4419 domain-containing protein n=1 Tax=Penicilliopsis zonata CBS 506.65 TaxID=1073090 RepID=A0A1L9SJJ5_9EURO|nr:hypothetical protein ASPZODRAFT_132383 [Penicilliopsis zonata CBS 506.65]OJJ47399.1 hypothetical protein ASPZODRAFT_132383 [Penicilliopsis zonata CBS 506.65]
MPVTLKPADHGARKWAPDRELTTTALFAKSCPREHDDSERVVRSGLSHSISETHISGTSHGFVRAVLDAYCYHHHLVLRPEDVWFSILNQLSFYIQAHAEELRDMFVAHQGQKRLTVHHSDNMATADFGYLAVKMTKEVEKHLLDPDLRTWIMPNFTTTTKTDTVVAAILMLGSMQRFFSYGFCLNCGIPSVTLLGEREDWELLLSKLEPLSTLGEEPALFAKLLRPILTRFVACFDDPEAPAAHEFWGRCADRSIGGSGPSYLSGWVTAFCFWDTEGYLLYREYPTWDACELDGVRYYKLDTDRIPPGYSSVPVDVTDEVGVKHDMVMVAGILGVHASSSGQPLEEAEAPEETGLDTIQPVAGWLMYEKKSLNKLPAKGKREEDEEGPYSPLGVQLYFEKDCWLETDRRPKKCRPEVENFDVLEDFDFDKFLAEEVVEEEVTFEEALPEETAV